MQIAWERDDVAFIAVVPVALAFIATSSNLCNGISYLVILDHIVLRSSGLYHNVLYHNTT